MSLLDPWNDGAAKSAVLDFVARVTTEGGGLTIVSMKQDWKSVFPGSAR